MAGFNYIKDIFPENRPLTANEINRTGLNGYSRNKLLNIISKIPANWSGIVDRASAEQTVIFPQPSIFINGLVYNIKLLDSKIIYKLLIQDIISLPKGLIRWCEDLELSDRQISCAFSFAANCTPNIFRRVFQY